MLTGRDVDWFVKALSVSEEVKLFDRPVSSPVCTGRYREGIPTLLRSLGAIDGVYPAGKPLTDGAIVLIRGSKVLVGRILLQFAGGVSIETARV